jgi:hypothetical protein
MISAFAMACASVMVVAKEFQLFQPIGGEGASTGLLLLFDVAAALEAVLGESRPSAPAAASNSRRLKAVDTVVRPPTTGPV